MQAQQAQQAQQLTGAGGQGSSHEQGGQVLAAHRAAQGDLEGREAGSHCTSGCCLRVAGQTRGGSSSKPTLLCAALTRAALQADNAGGPLLAAAAGPSGLGSSPRTTQQKHSRGTAAGPHLAGRQAPRYAHPGRPQRPPNHTPGTSCRATDLQHQQTLTLPEGRPSAMISTGGQPVPSVQLALTPSCTRPSTRSCKSTAGALPIQYGVE